MAGTVNKVILLGRITRDVETRSFPNGGGVTAFGFVVENAKKNAQTGKWEDEPVWLDCEAFVSADGKGKGKVIADYARKGDRLLIEGHLKLDTWQDKNSGEKRQKLKVVVDQVTLIEKKGDNGNGGDRPAPARAQAPAAADFPEIPDGAGGDIPF
jgi:single-strand DNA-binding protein